MGHAERIPAYAAPAAAPAPESRSPLSPAPCRRPARSVALVLLLGATAVAYLAACVRTSRLGADYHKAREACTRTEAEIGELVIANSVLTEPASVERAARYRGSVAPAATDRLAVSPDLLPGAGPREGGSPSPGRPSAAAWATLGPVQP